MNSGIYKIINTSNNKSYIGSSKDIDFRINTHFNRLLNNKHPNKHLQLSYNKYGSESFKWEIVKQCNINELLEVEQQYIDNEDINNLYNKALITKGGGSEVLSIPVLLLDLNGNILEEYKSMSDLSKTHKRRIQKSSDINKGSIFKKEYRIVTKEFYEKELDTILSWKNYSNKSVKRHNDKILKQILIVEVNGKSYEFNSRKEVCSFLGVTRERVRQILVSGMSKKVKIKRKYENI